MARWGIVYDKKALIKDIAIFLVLMIAMYVTHGPGFLLMYLFAFSALSKDDHERLLLVMLITVGFLVGNPTLMPRDIVYSVSQKLLMVGLACALMFRSTGKHQSPLLTPYLGIMPYMVWATLISAQGFYPVIAYLKIFLFICCFFALYGIANTVILGERLPIVRVRSVFLSLCCFTLFGSMMLIPFPGIGMMKAEAYLEAVAAGADIPSLFQGMMYHSQALGPLAAMLGVALFTDFIFTVRKPDKLYIALLLTVPILIYKTSSRTAMGTLIAGLGFALWIFLRTRQVGNVWRARVLSTMVGLVILGATALAISDAGRKAFASYVLKYSGSNASMQGVTMDDVIVTRQGLIDESMEAFKKKPLTGNGFQVKEDIPLARSKGIMSILSAPVEKGVWITAILEETGVPGMILFVVWGLAAIPMLVKRKSYSGATMLFMMFVVNLGEFTFFSMSGIGGYYWALCFMCAVMDAQRLREYKIVTWYATEEDIERDPDLNPYA